MNFKFELCNYILADDVRETAICNVHHFNFISGISALKFIHCTIPLYSLSKLQSPCQLTFLPYQAKRREE